MADGTCIECTYKTRHIQTTVVAVVGIRDATYGQSTAICTVCHLCAIATEGINQTCKLNQVAESDVVPDGKSTIVVAILDATARNLVNQAYNLSACLLRALSDGHLTSVLAILERRSCSVRYNTCTISIATLTAESDIARVLQVAEYGLLTYNRNNTCNTSNKQVLTTYRLCSLSDIAIVYAVVELGKWSLIRHT